MRRGEESSGSRDPEERKPRADEPARPGEPRMHLGFERIVSSLYEVDVWEAYERARDGLSLPVTAERASKDDLRRELHHCEDRAREAHVLWCNAKVAVKEWDAECEVATTHLRSEAQTRLAEEKSEGRRPKQITDGDVEAEMARASPDEFRRQKVGREKRHRMVDHLEFLAGRWVARRNTLEAMLTTARGA